MKTAATSPGDIARHFVFPGRLVSCREYGAGNVNDTYLATSEEDGKAFPFILQRLNPAVFKAPEEIMRNLRVLNDHVEAKLARAESPPWAFPAIIPCRSGLDFHRAPDGGFWRALSFIPDTECFAVIQNSDQAREAGRALGIFHSLVRDLPAELLHDTLPNFHVTPQYLRRYTEIDQAPARPDQSATARFCREFIAARQAQVTVLEDARGRGELLLCPIHGDPKPANILFARDTGRAVSLIDLDTTKPGLLHYDIGDCLRSCCNPAGEDAPLREVRFDLACCAAILQGYLPQVASFFTAFDYRYLHAAVRLIAFELGLRFFTDHLAGDVYFKTRHPGHNLHRAQVQFLLCQRIEEQEEEIGRLIEESARHA
ncbi:phosphotransferase enzyme family protein [Thiovibrio sp. JS02]